MARVAVSAIRLNGGCPHADAAVTLVVARLVADRIVQFGVTEERGDRPPAAGTSARGAAHVGQLAVARCREVDRGRVADGGVVPGRHEELLRRPHDVVGALADPLRLQQDTTCDGPPARLEGGRHAVRQHRAQGFHACHGHPVGKPVAHLCEHRRGTGQGRGSLAYRGGQQKPRTAGAHSPCGASSSERWSATEKDAHFLDRVTPELDPHRMLVRRGNPSRMPPERQAGRGARRGPPGSYPQADEALEPDHHTACSSQERRTGATSAMSATTGCRKARTDVATTSTGQRHRGLWIRVGQAAHDGHAPSHGVR